ncbi:MurR/RpiR family transcriptional regulator [Bombilactobacillus bombi]|uniref:MurR/RpiR family transcriptional regulator n=1 Tax=Bombilactobacillus bombi TaxID=1303590 RepID=A0A3R6YLR3_9LACO|nr:MurR/RpiR family transcriptional regulator [Bombilactobacillus bombi]RHW50032.1 MurR/RpiR family transcriptional regulator [Bombilactobacillus bombi]
MTFEERVINKSNIFTDLEDDIIAYIKSNKNNIEHLKITYLAKKFYTVPNTITRLCHKLGYSGFSELKSSIKNEYFNKNLLFKHGESIIKNIELIEQMPVDIVTDKLRTAKKINFYSMGQTAYVTRLIVGNFYAVDYKSYFYNYPNELEHIILNKTDELFFLISLSGENQQMIDMAKEVKRHHNYLITLTHLSNNRLSNLADLRLFCYSPNKRIDEYNVTDKAPILLVMNEIFKIYAEKLNKQIINV